jgi:glycosyltransferase involved in cell wall biosynthesis
MKPDNAGNPDVLILTFPAGSSLSRWERFGVLDREFPFLRRVVRDIPRVVFVSEAGVDERRIARSMSDRLGLEADAISEAELDPNLGVHRTIEERVLASVQGAGRVVIQTMQFDDTGLGARLLPPLRRAGMNAALIARGSFIDSRVLATTAGPSHFSTLRAAEIEARVCARAQIVIGTSEAMIDELSWKYGISSERTRVVSQHVSVDRLSIEREKNLIVTTGRFSGECTAFRMAIEAVAQLSEERRRSVRLDVIGDGPAGRDLPEYARSLGVNAEFKRGLTHAELIASLARATAYIQAETARRQSHIVLEAMAMGCPVVVSDLPEYNGIIINGSSGLRVAREARAFSFAIDCLLGDPGFCQMLGDTAHTQIAFRCNVERVVDDTLACYRDALRMAPQQGDLGDRWAS